MWYYRELVLFLGSLVFLTALVLPVIVFFISIGKSWILFFFMVATLVIVASGRPGCIFPGLGGLLQILMNLIYGIGIPCFG